MNHTPRNTISVSVNEGGHKSGGGGAQKTQTTKNGVLSRRPSCPTRTTEKQTKDSATILDFRTIPSVLLNRDLTPTHG